MLCLLVFVLLSVRILARYVFHMSMLWLSPLISIIFLWCAVLSISYVLKKRGHMAIFVVRDLFPKKMVLFINLIIYFLMVCTFLVLLVSTINIFPVHRQRMIFGLGVPVTYFTTTVLYLAFSGVITCTQFCFLELKKIILKNKDDSGSKIKTKKHLISEI